MKQGLLFVVSGPSGAGKTSLLERLFAQDDNLRFSVSMTTRPPRPEEREGRDYFFVTPEVFAQARREGQLLEWAEVHGYFYGTPQAEVEKLQREGWDVVLDIDVQGAHQVRERAEDAIFIFISPPSLEVLGERLRARGTEKETDLARRLADAEWEMGFREEFDYEVVNDSLEVAADQLRAIVVAERCRIRRNPTNQ
ncbi:MAG TPA: guanylate kinase [Armatimonadetes bacterium]|nr:guanylate kinase [Armatimonadota bacterium]